VHTETEEPHVVYRALYGNYTLCIRPLNVFVEDIEKADYTGPRFKQMKVF